MRPSHMITLGLVLVGALPGDRARAVQATSDNAQEPADEATASQSRISSKKSRDQRKLEHYKSFLWSAWMLSQPKTF